MSPSPQCPKDSVGLCFSRHWHLQFHSLATEKQKQNKIITIGGKKRSRVGNRTIVHAIVKARVGNRSNKSKSVVRCDCLLFLLHTLISEQPLWVSLEV